MSDEMTEESIAEEIDLLALDVGPDADILLSGEKNESSEADSIKEYKGLLVALFTPTFSLLAPAWNIQESEIEALSDAYSGVLQKYFPDGTKAVGAELGAALVTIAIFAPRVSLPRVVVDDSQSDGGKKDG